MQSYGQDPNLGPAVRREQGMSNRGPNYWQAAFIGLAALVMVVLVSVVVFANMNSHGSGPSHPTLNDQSSASPSNGQQSPSASPTASASDEVANGTESPGCLNKTRWQESPQVGETADQDPTAGEDWHVPCTSMNRIINIWFKGTSISGEHKLLLSAGCDITIKSAGGAMWSFLFSGEALGNYQGAGGNSNPPITLDELRSAGLVTSESGCNGMPSGPSSSQNPGSSQAPSGDTGQPAPQDGCTTTNKQTTPDELVEAGTQKPLNILHRIDSFGYSGWSLTEFYTLISDKSELGAHRVPTIGYVGQPRADLNGLVGLWFGEGSAWDYGDNGAQCSKDFALKWATFYAVSGAIEPGRLDNGNSGIVVTMDDCKLYNNRPDLGWNHDNIQALLNEHLANMVTFPCQSLTDNSDGSTYEVTPGARDLRGSDENLPSGPDANTSGGSCGQTRDSENFGSNFQGKKLWHITTSDNEVAIVNFWSNWTDPNYPFVKFQLGPNSDVQLKGGGDVTYLPADCQDVITTAMKNLAGGQKVVDFSDIPSKLKK